MTEPKNKLSIDSLPLWKPKPMSTKYVVLAYNEIQFKRWMTTKDRKLQDCKRIGNIQDMQGLTFTDPLRELVVLLQWSEGKNKEFVQEGARLIARYCQDRRIVGGIKPELVEI